MRSTNERVINDRKTAFVNDIFSPFLRFNYNGITWVDLKYNATVLFISSQDRRIQQRTQAVNLDFILHKSLILQTKIEHYAIFGTGGKSNYLFPDLVVRFLPKKKGHALEMQWLNLLNLNTFRTFNVNDFQYSESSYNLRPRQIMVRGRLNI